MGKDDAIAIDESEAQRGTEQKDGSDSRSKAFEPQQRVKEDRREVKAAAPRQKPLQRRGIQAKDVDAFMESAPSGTQASAEGGSFFSRVSQAMDDQEFASGDDA